MQAAIHVTSGLLAEMRLELRQARLDVLRTELEAGLTLLDVAAGTRDTVRRHRMVLHAMAALEKAYAFQGASPFGFPDIRQRCEQLRDRLVMEARLG